MKKQSEKPPIDDLFARKLGNMSLPPSTDAFERLQARMNQQKSEVRLVFWRNPSVQRYMAVAACLLLVCLFSWQYRLGNTDESTDRVATISKPLHAHTNSEKLAQQSEKKLLEIEKKAQTISLGSLERESSESRIARVQPASKPNRRAVTKLAAMNPGPTVAINKTAGNSDKAVKEATISEGKPTIALITKEPVAEVKALDHVAQNRVKPTPVGERVLVVTIAEPVALVAAHTDVKPATDIKPMLVSTEKEEPKAPTKIGNLWQQVKRVKSGEAFASRNTSNDERGLLGRAYTELKQTLDKDKPLKQ